MPASMKERDSDTGQFIDPRFVDGKLVSSVLESVQRIGEGVE